MEKEKETAAEEDRISKEFCPALLRHINNSLGEKVMKETLEKIHKIIKEALPYTALAALVLCIYNTIQISQTQKHVRSTGYDVIDAIESNTSKIKSRFEDIESRIDDIESNVSDIQSCSEDVGSSFEDIGSNFEIQKAE